MIVFQLVRREHVCKYYLVYENVYGIIRHIAHHEVSMANGITTLTRDIAPGEVFKHKGSLELNGSIGAGATVTITDGGIHVTGNVGEDARVTANGGGHSISISGSNNVVINGDLVGGRVIVNGRVISGGGSNVQSGLSGITIDGDAGFRVILHTDGALEIKGNAANELQLRADGSITLNDAGAALTARSGGSFHAENIGSGAGITSGGSLHVEELGNNSTSNSGGSSHIEKIGTDAKASSGGSMNIGSIGAHSRANGGGSLKAQLAHSTAQLSSGGSKKVARVSDDDGEFKLSQAFGDAAAPTAKPAVQDDAPKPPKKPGFTL